MKIIYQSGNTSEAHIIAGLLNSHGIQAHVSGSYLQGGIGDLAAMDFVSIQVANADVEKAHTIIAEYDNSQITTQEPQDRRNSSTTNKVYLAVFVAIIAFIVFASIM